MRHPAFLFLLRFFSLCLHFRVPNLYSGLYQWLLTRNAVTPGAYDRSRRHQRTEHVLQRHSRGHRQVLVKKNPRSDLLDGGEGGCEGHTRWRDAISITYGAISLQGIHRRNELLVGLGCLQAIYRFALAFLLGHRSLRKSGHVFALEPLVHPFSLQLHPLLADSR